MAGDRSAPLTRRFVRRPVGAGRRGVRATVAPATQAAPAERRTWAAAARVAPWCAHRRPPGPADRQPAPAPGRRPARAGGPGRSGPSGRAGPPHQARPDGGTQRPPHRPGEMLGLVEAPPPAPGGRGRRPGDDVDRARKPGPERSHQGGRQDREGRPGVAVFQPGEGLPHRPLVGEGGDPPVEPLVGGARPPSRAGRRRRRPGTARPAAPRSPTHRAGNTHVEQRPQPSPWRRTYRAGCDSDAGPAGRVRLASLGVGSNAWGRGGCRASRARCHDAARPGRPRAARGAGRGPHRRRLRGFENPESAPWDGADRLLLRLQHRPGPIDPLGREPDGYLSKLSGAGPPRGRQVGHRPAVAEGHPPVGRRPPGGRRRPARGRSTSPGRRSAGRSTSTRSAPSSPTT